jgi:chromosome partitioning protein
LRLATFFRRKKYFYSGRKIMIVVVGGEKGGTGKTTTAVNLAFMRERDKGDTILVDADPQQTSSLWCLSREDSKLSPRITSVSKLGKALGSNLLSLSQKYSTVIVDTGGRDSVELRSGLLAANIVVCPVKSSDFDAWTLDRMNKLIGDAKQFNDSIQAYILINEVSTNSFVDEMKEAQDYFYDGEYENLQLLKSKICHRRIYKKVGGGLSVHDVGTDAKAEAEVEQLYKEIFNV